MALDPRVASLLQREFGTIKTVRDPALMNALGQIRAEMSSRGMGAGTPRVHAVDKRCATEYLERSAEYLERALRRLTELREPWTESLRSDVEALLRSELMQDWNWLVGVRDNDLGADLKDHNTGQITAAQNTAIRRIEEELAFRVLREEARKIPLSDLLAAPRYAGVARHWEMANGYAAQSPYSDSEATREAVLALEALARLAVGDGTVTLGAAIQMLRARTDDAGRHLLSSIEKIWNFSNTAPSIRHGGGSGDPVSTPEAQFVVGATREALRFLMAFDLD